MQVIIEIIWKNPSRNDSSNVLVGINDQNNSCRSVPASKSNNYVEPQLFILPDFLEVKLHNIIVNNLACTCQEHKYHYNILTVR